MLQDPLAWPGWWRGVERVSELDGGDAQRVGSRYRIAWRSRIPYELGFDFTVSRVDPPCCMEGDAAGDLAGHGRWLLFERNHDLVMRWGGEGLARRLGVELIASG